MWGVAFDRSQSNVSLMIIVHLRLQGGLLEGNDAQFDGQYYSAQNSHDLDFSLSFYS